MNIFFYILLIILFIIYIYIIKFILPGFFISYENYHGIEFLNDIFITNYNIIDYFKQLFLYGGKDDGHINRILYGFLVDNLSLGLNSIFYIQSFLSIISYGFLSISLYFLSNKNKYLSFILFILLLISPHQIKYGFSEDYYILGNFFISISLFSLVYFLEKSKLIYFGIFILSFLFSIYTRTLYLLYIPIFSFIILYMVKFDFNNIKNHLNKNIYKILSIFIGIIFILFPISERFKVLFFQSDKFSGSFNNNIIDIITSQNALLLKANISYYNVIYNFLIYLGLIFLLFYFIKNRSYFKSLIVSFFFIYINFLFYKYINSGLGYGLVLERHILLLEPIYLIFTSIGLYSIFYFIFKLFPKFYSNLFYLIIIILLSIIPFYFKDYILENYSYQKEFIFLNNNISKIGNNFNLVIPNYSVNKVDYDFPVFLFKKIKDYNIYLYYISSLDKNTYSSFIDNYEYIKDKDNIFYLSTACYSSGDSPSDFILENGIREDCKYMLDNFNLEAIVEYKMIPETYIIPHLNTPLKTITIGFYKIKGKK